MAPILFWMALSSAIQLRSGMAVIASVEILTSCTLLFLTPLTKTLFLLLSQRAPTSSSDTSEDYEVPISHHPGMRGYPPSFRPALSPKPPSMEDDSEDSRGVFSGFSKAVICGLLWEHPGAYFVLSLLLSPVNTKRCICFLSEYAHVDPVSTVFARSCYWPIFAYCFFFLCFCMLYDNFPNC